MKLKFLPVVVRTRKEREGNDEQHRETYSFFLKIMAKQVYRGQITDSNVTNVSEYYQCLKELVSLYNLSIFLM